MRKVVTGLLLSALLMGVAPLRPAHASHGSRNLAIGVGVVVVGAYLWHQHEQHQTKTAALPQGNSRYLAQIAVPATAQAH